MRSLDGTVRFQVPIFSIGDTRGKHSTPRHGDGASSGCQNSHDAVSVTVRDRLQLLALPFLRRDGLVVLPLLAVHGQWLREACVGHERLSHTH